MSRSLDDLDSPVREQARKLIAALIVEGIPHVVIETRRPQLTQLAYWLQGRADVFTVVKVREAAGLPGISEAEAKRVITQLDGVTKRSRHQDGHAIDIVPADGAGNPRWSDVQGYKAIGKIARQMGWTCGQDWAPIDPATGLGWDSPHYEI